MLFARKKVVSAGVVAAMASLFTNISIAAVGADEAKQLGGSVLTAMGSEKAGNKEGTIPEYTGQGVKISGVDANEPGRRPDPFADEKPLFAITAQNAAQYADKLDGQVELFKKYPSYRMDIYPSHRTVTLPKFVLDNTLKNATECKGTQDELVLSGCYAGVPFPIPKTGRQVMWNHLTAYEFRTATLNNVSYIVPNGGKPVSVGVLVGAQSWPIYDSKRTTPMQPGDVYWRVRLDYTAPARRVGEKLVVIDHVDPINAGRRAYAYIPGQRRVKLAPDLAYDTPSPTAAGASTMDDGKVFLGSMDRFDYKLVGKKEKFIPYNAYRSVDLKACPAEKLMSTNNFINPDCLRYELHRVWVVEAMLKPQFRHIYHKRKFFWDEDGFGGGTSENYDAGSKLYRHIQMLTYSLPEGGASLTTWEVNDLQTGSYSPQGWTGFSGGGYWAMPEKPDAYYSPEALAGEGIR